MRHGRSNELMWKPFWVCVVALAALGSPMSAAAQVTGALMHRLGGNAEIPEALRSEARNAAMAFLRSEDVIMLEQDRVQASLDEAQQACVPGGACVGAVRSAVGVDLLVGLTLQGRPSDPAAPGRVQVSILDGTGASYAASAEVGSDVASAVREALGSAIADQRRGPGPFLHVDGTGDALCELDGAALGTIPLLAGVTPGEHELTIRLEGFETQTINVTIADDPTGTTDIEITLVRGPAGGAASDATEPDVALNLILAGGLGAAGVALMIAPLVTLATDGECVDPAPGGACYERRAFGALSGVLLGVGGALLVAGIVIAIAQPITVSASVSANHASIDLRGSFQ